MPLPPLFGRAALTKRRASKGSHFGPAASKARGNAARWFCLVSVLVSVLVLFVLSVSVSTSAASSVDVTPWGVTPIIAASATPEPAGQEFFYHGICDITYLGTNPIGTACDKFYNLFHYQYDISNFAYADIYGWTEYQPLTSVMNAGTGYWVDCEIVWNISPVCTYNMHSIDIRLYEPVLYWFNGANTIWSTEPGCDLGKSLGENDYSGSCIAHLYTDITQPYPVVPNTWTALQFPYIRTRLGCDNRYCKATNNCYKNLVMTADIECSPAYSGFPLPTVEPTVEVGLTPIGGGGLGLTGTWTTTVTPEPFPIALYPPTYTECTDLVPSISISETVLGQDIVWDWGGVTICVSAWDLDILFLGFDITMFLIAALGVGVAAIVWGVLKG